MLDVYRFLLTRWPILAALAFVATGRAQGVVSVAGDSGTYYEVNYPPGNEAHELAYGSMFTLWVPNGIRDLRAIIVHQHGCGINPSKYGHMIAYDLHWQALARKWHCALLGPSFFMSRPSDACVKWCDPRNGSDQVFLRALADLATRSAHPELVRAPWCLWGHSGGGNWASVMQLLHPERIVAIWFRSGSAYPHWQDGSIPRLEVPAAALTIPMMCNCGAKEKDDPVYKNGWANPRAMFTAYRAAGAPIGWATDPLTAHATGDSRYLAIPFFDACLGLRLPPSGEDPTRLQSIDVNQGWLAPLDGNVALPAVDFKGDVKQSVWLPNATVAKAWMEFVRSGGSNDTTPPPTPTGLNLKVTADGVQLAWSADIDLESGLRQFIIERDGREIGRVPEQPLGRNGRALFQPISTWDTPLYPAPAMTFLDRSAGANSTYAYRVIAVNSAGLRSP